MNPIASVDDQVDRYTLKGALGDADVYESLKGSYSSEGASILSCRIEIQICVEAAVAAL